MNSTPKSFDALHPANPNRPAASHHILLLQTRLNTRLKSFCVWDTHIHIHIHIHIQQLQPRARDNSASSALFVSLHSYPRPPIRQRQHGRHGIRGTRQRVLFLLLQSRRLWHARLLPRERPLRPLPVLKAACSCSRGLYRTAHLGGLHGDVAAGGRHVRSMQARAAADPPSPANTEQLWR